MKLAARIVLSALLAPGLYAAPQAFPGSGAGGLVYALDTFQGQLVAAGEFSAVGGTPAHGVARWDGVAWSPFGAPPFDGVDGPRFARVFDVEVLGDRLYVAGAFLTAGGVVVNNVACWDELAQAWLPLAGGTDGWVFALEVYDDGTGAKLYAGGDFQTAGGVPAAGLARWDELTQSWSAVGAFDGPVNALLATSFEGQDRLFIGGDFEVAGPVGARNLVSLTGSTFQPLANAFNNGVDGVVLSLAVFDDGGGGGPALFVGGDFQTAANVPAARVAFWRGGSWTALGSGVGAGATEDVRTMVSYDDGSGPVLVVGGRVTRVGTVAVDTTTPFGGQGGTTIPAVNNHGDDTLGGGNSVVGSWDGTSWSGVGQNMNDTVFDMEVVGGQLFAAGRFTSADTEHMQRIARWDPGQGKWIALATGSGLGHTVRAFATLDVGDGEKLIAAGDFVTAGSGAAKRIAQWEGLQQQWVPLDAGTNGRVLALSPLPGFGLAVGGAFTEAGGMPASRVALWDAVGSSWVPLGTGMDAPVHALISHDDGSGGALYAAGEFEQAGGTTAYHIARWDGSAWADLPAGGLDDTVRALARFQGDLIAGGDFSSASGVSLSGIARWDGTAWTPVGSGFDGNVHALYAAPGALYAGGTFSVAGTVEVANVARWNGFAWQPLGSGVDGPVAALHGDGGAGTLYVGGRFRNAGGQPAANLAAWDGLTWSELGGGADDWVRALRRFGPTLYAGGNFSLVGGAPSSHVVGVPAP